MSSTRITTVGGRHYLQEVRSVWDPKKKRASIAVISHLGPCNKDGKLLRPSRTRVENVQSAFPVGRLMVLHAAAKNLHLLDHLSSIVPKDSAKLLLCLALNQATTRVPIYRLPEWIEASPLPKWEGIDAQSLTVRHFEDALSALCHLTPQKTWENNGYLLQKILTKAWRGTSREPAGAYYDITKQSYYGTHCPYGQLGHDEDGGTSLVVGFGMVVSKEHHHPILCQTFPGGQGDTLSVVSVLEMLQGQCLRNLTLVMDKGMTSKDNVHKIVDAGYHLVGSIKGWNKETIAYGSRWQGEGLERTQNGNNAQRVALPSRKCLAKNWMMMFFRDHHAKTYDQRCSAVFIMTQLTVRTMGAVVRLFCYVVICSCRLSRCSSPRFRQDFLKEIPLILPRFLRRKMAECRNRLFKLLRCESPRIYPFPFW